ncbi:uncharacterized protein LOC143282372 isoform X2 [Babylonia areolata]
MSSLSSTDNHNDFSSNSNSNSSNSVNDDDDKAGLIYCWGNGDLGQHGQGHSSDVSFLWSEVRQFGSATAQGAVTSVSCGAHHCVAVTDSGEVYTWGDGRYGQLGCGDETWRQQPTAVFMYQPPLRRGTKVRTSACGRRHTLLLLDNGQVYSCGHNGCSQLGIGSRNRKTAAGNQLRPCLLERLAPRTVMQVACGDRHSLFLFDDGGVAAVGNNAHGQIGDGGRDGARVPKTVDLSNSRVTSVACGANHNLVITESRDVYCWGFGKACGKRHCDVMTPEMVPFKGRQVVQVAGGRTHSLALTAAGQVMSWGLGKYGQLGLGSVVISSQPRRLRHTCLEEGVSSVACGDAYSAVVTVSGRLYMWGRNSHLIEEWMEPRHAVWEPQCLNPEPLPALRHVACGVRHAVALGGLPDFVHTADSDDEDEVTTSESEAESDVTLSSGCSDDESDTSTSTKAYSSYASEEDSDNAETGLPELTSFASTKVRGGAGKEEEGGSRHPTEGSSRPLVPEKLTKLTIGEFYCLSPDCSFPVDTNSSFLTTTCDDEPSLGMTTSFPTPSPHHQHQHHHHHDHRASTSTYHHPSTLPSIAGTSASVNHQRGLPPQGAGSATRREDSITTTSTKHHKKPEASSVHTMDPNHLLPENMAVRSRSSAHSTRSRSTTTTTTTKSASSIRSSAAAAASSSFFPSLAGSRRPPTAAQHDHVEPPPMLRGMVTGHGDGGGEEEEEKQLAENVLSSTGLASRGAASEAFPRPQRTGQIQADRRSPARKNNNKKKKEQDQSSPLLLLLAGPGEQSNKRRGGGGGGGGGGVAVVSRNMDILDVNQLRVAPGPSNASPSSSSSPHPCPASRSPPGRPTYGGGGGGGGGPERAGVAGLFYEGCGEEVGDGANCPKPSPTTTTTTITTTTTTGTGVHHASDGPTPLLLHRVSALHIDGHLVPDKVKNSSTLFGALSGHMTRSATKFFKKPVPIGHLSKTIAPVSQPSQPSVSFAQLLQAGYLSDPNLGGGGGGGGRGSEMPPKSGTRGLGAVGGATTVAEAVPPEEGQPSSTNSQLLHVTFQQDAAQDPDRRTSKKVLFTVDSSTWKGRLPLLGGEKEKKEGEKEGELGEEEKKAQSAPSRRKRVSFADDVRSTSVQGQHTAHHHHRPTLAAAFAAVSPRPDPRPTFLAGNSRRVSSSSSSSSRPTEDHPAEEEKESRNATTTNNLATAKKSLHKHKEESKFSSFHTHKEEVGFMSRFTPALFGNGNHVSAVAAHLGRSQRQPTLAYRRHSPRQHVSHPASSAPRSGTLRTLLSGGGGRGGGDGPPRSALKSGEGHSRLGLTVSGSRGREVRRAHFE